MLQQPPHAPTFIFSSTVPFIDQKNFPELAVNHGQSTYPHVRYRYDPAINKHSRPEAQCTPKPVAQARAKPVALIARGQLSMANHTLSAICSRRRAHYANRITIPFKASLVQHIAIIQVRSSAWPPNYGRPLCYQLTTANAALIIPVKPVGRAHNMLTLHCL